MLRTLRRIVQEVNSAEDLTQALNLIVIEVKQAIAVDVCSIYLNLPDSAELTLMATDGLDQAAVGQTKLMMNEGLVGLVAERSEPVNLSDASSHPHFKLIEGIGEESFHSFLGIPILHHRRLLGVLVVQHTQ